MVAVAETETGKKTEDQRMGAEWKPLAEWLEMKGISKVESRLIVSGAKVFYGEVAGILQGFKMGISGTVGEYSPHLLFSISGFTDKDKRASILESLRGFRRVLDGEAFTADVMYGQLPVEEDNYIGTVGLTPVDAAEELRQHLRQIQRIPFDPEMAVKGH